MSPVECGNLLGRNFDFLFLAEGEDEHGQKDAKHTDPCHPPDVPDQRKAADHGEEGGAEASGAVLGDLDRRVLALLNWRRLMTERALLRLPIRIDVGDL